MLADQPALRRRPLLFAGTSGVFSFGHIGFAAIGAYAAGIFPSRPRRRAGSSRRCRPRSAMPTGPSRPCSSAGSSPLRRGRLPLSWRLSGLAASLATFALLIIVHVVARTSTSRTAPPGWQRPDDDDARRALLVWSRRSSSFAFQESRFGAACGRRARTRSRRARRGRRLLRTPPRRRPERLHHRHRGRALRPVPRHHRPDAFYLNITFLVIAMLVVGGRTSLAGAVFGTVSSRRCRSSSTTSSRASTSAPCS